MSTPGDHLGASVTAYCAQIGADPLLVQGAGGNVSWKDSTRLWIKASGTWLADADRDDIFVAVDVPSLVASIDQGDYNVTPVLAMPQTLKPSIETLLHAILPHKVVVHLHAIEVLASLVRKDCAHFIESALRDFSSNGPAGVPIVWASVPYAKPGPTLAMAVHEVTKRIPHLNVVLLENHGVVIGGESVTEVDSILKHLCSHFKEDPLTPVVASNHSLPSSPVTDAYEQVADDGIQQLAVDTRLYDQLESNWALYPDHVVFLGPKAYFFASLHEFMARYQVPKQLPDLIFIKNVGVFVKDNFSKAKLLQLRCYYDVLSRQMPGSKLRSLSTVEVAEILDWDAEKYRQSLVK